MSVALEDFVLQIQQTGIVDWETVCDLLPPRRFATDALALARELIQQKQLTPFQADAICRGEGKSLTLGNYVLIGKIAAGGMGQVFKARHRRMDRIVAIKTLSPNFVKDDAAIARFEREVKAVAKLSHPNIVAAHDADCADGVHFLVMEYVDGSDLAKLVQRNGPLPAAKAVGYIIQAARGLEAAHAAGVIHHDVSPANLLLDKTGTVKILDLGLARIHSVGLAAAGDLTCDGALIGTVDYMAPEQARHTRTADAAADVYSLGCTLFYLIAGRPPFAGDGAIGKLLAHMSEPIPALAALQQEASEPLQLIFSKMLAKEPKDRYQSMTEVIANLEGCVFPGDSVPWPIESARIDEDDAAETAVLSDGPLPVKTSAVRGGVRTQRRRKALFVGSAAFAPLLFLGCLYFCTNGREGSLIVRADAPGATVPAFDQREAVELPKDPGLKQITVDLNDDKEGWIAALGECDFFSAVLPMNASNKRGVVAELVLCPPRIKAPVRLPDVFAAESAETVWRREVAGLPAEEQVQAVVTKLRELNPGFDGQATHGIKDGVVTALFFKSDNIADLSPAAALRNLKLLFCDGSSSAKGRLKDLSPLRGLRLQVVNCGNSQVEDLAPLKGMPLEKLIVGNTLIADLSPLQGIALTFLDCANCPTADLRPLRGAPLKTLNIHTTLVSELTPLRGMMLRYFDCAFTRVADLTPLEGMPLTFLDCGWCPVTDLRPLKGMRLKTLCIGGTKATDFSPLSGMPLTDLSLFNLASLGDLSMVKGMKLTSLNFANTRVVDLSPLKEMKPLVLDFACTAVGDLSPLAGMPLTVLRCYGTEVSDFSPVAKSPLKDLRADVDLRRDGAVLKGIETLETINGEPAAKFWKDAK